MPLSEREFEDAATQVVPVARPRGRPGFWERRYLLRHYRDFDDASLAAGSGLSVRAVGEFLAAQGAVRTAGDLRRIEKRPWCEPPAMFTPAAARQAVTRVQARTLTRMDQALIVGLFLASLGLYAVTCARTVTGEDAGEFLAAAHGFGVPHPPGYPLWLLLAWLADHASGLVSVAWRVAMVSAVFSAAANALLLAVLLKTLRSRLAACTGAALFAISLTHWTQAVIPEVYGLNTFFIALQVLLLVGLVEKPTQGRLVALAAVTGLSATNHTSALPMGAVVVLAAVLAAPGLLRSWRTILLAGLAGLVPLLLYLVLPLASAGQPYTDWGNPETASAFWQHVTRAQYASVEAEAQATGSYSDYLARLGILGEWASKQFGSGWVLLLAALGVIPLFIRHTGLWLLLVAIGWLSSVGITQYAAFPFEREHLYAVQIFWIPAWLAVAWFVGGGIDTLVHAVGRLQQPLSRRWAQAAAGVGCLALVVWPGAAHFARADRSRTTAVAEFGKAILDTMERGALYFPSSDHSTFSVMYWQGVEGYRTDVVLADKYGRIEPAFVDRFLDEGEREIWQGLPGKERRDFEEAVLSRKWPWPVYFANRRESGDLAGLSLEPVGPIFQVMSPEASDALWAKGDDGGEPAGLRAWDGCLALLDRDERERLDFTVQMLQADMLYMRGCALLRAGRLDEALVAWQAIRGDLAPLKQALNNIGSALAEAGELSAAVPFFDKARAEDARYTLALRNEALVLRNLGDRERAIELLQRLVALDTQQRDSRMALAHLLDDQDRPLEALAEFEALAAADPEDPAPWRDAGELLARRGDRMKAAKAFREALRLAPGDSTASEGLDRLDRSNDLTLDQLGGLTAAEGDGGDFEARGLGVPPLPPLPGDLAPGLGFEPARPGGIAPPR